MIPRAVTGLARERLRRYPAVALVGPRQCGKTPLARSFPVAYFDLEQAADLAAATRRFLVSRVRRPAGNDRTLSCGLPLFLEKLRGAPA